MYKVFELKDAKEWRSCWERLPVNQRSVYLLPEYYSIYENLNHGKAFCFFYESESCLLLYPFLKRDLDFLQLDTAQSCFDVEGAYGLNGAGHANLEASDFECIAASWAEYCASQYIIAEFTRLNPMLCTCEVLPYLQYVVANQVVVVDLTCENILYDSYEHSVRKAIKKAERLDVSIESYSSDDLPDKYLTEFYKIYESTMDRKSASDFYYFGETYFKSIKQILNNNSRWFFSLLAGNIVSVELVLFDEYSCYSFLGGTLKEGLPSGANVLLKHHIIMFFREKNLAYYFLGGGTTKNDGIYAYKKSFSKNEPRDFYIGKKVHSTNMYNTAIKKWEFLHPDKCEAFKSYFLKYRC